MPCGELVLGRPEGQPDALESDQSRDDGGMEDGEAGEVGERDAPDAGVPREKPTALDGAFKRVPGSNVGIAAAAD